MKLRLMCAYERTFGTTTWRCVLPYHFGDRHFCVARKAGEHLWGPSHLATR